LRIGQAVYECVEDVLEIEVAEDDEAE